MLKKLRVKFVCITMAIVLGMLCVIFGLVIKFTARSLEAESIQLLRTLASSSFQQGRPGETTQQVQLPYFILQRNILGQILVKNGGPYDLTDEEFLRQILEAAFDGAADVGILEEYNLRFYRVSSSVSQTVAFADTSSEAVTIENLVRTCILIGFLALVIFLAVSLWLARWAVKPVDLAWQQQHQFVADASHELKTPLTVILTNAELLQDPVYGPEEKERFAGSILTMSHQMKGLVEGLLELARVDNGTLRTTMEEMDLSSLVSDVILPFEPLFFEQNLELRSHLEAGLRLRGSPAHLRQVAEILLDNALKYSHAPGTVHLRLRKLGSTCVLSVASPGTPLSPADRVNIFKRFYRGDEARTRSGSYGLGLSIAQGIVKTHRGRIWAESTDGYNIFFVQLPV